MRVTEAIVGLTNLRTSGIATGSPEFLAETMNTFPSPGDFNVDEIVPIAGAISDRVVGRIASFHSFAQGLTADKDSFDWCSNLLTSRLALDSLGINVDSMFIPIVAPNPSSLYGRSYTSAVLGGLIKNFEGSDREFEARMVLLNQRLTAQPEKLRVVESIYIPKVSRLQSALSSLSGGPNWKRTKSRAQETKVILNGQSGPLTEQIPRSRSSLIGSVDWTEIAELGGKYYKNKSAEEREMEAIDIVVEIINVLAKDIADERLKKIVELFYNYETPSEKARFIISLANSEYINYLIKTHDKDAVIEKTMILSDSIQKSVSAIFDNYLHNLKLTDSEQEQFIAVLQVATEMSKTVNNKSS